MWREPPALDGGAPGARSGRQKPSSKEGRHEQDVGRRSEKSAQQTMAGAEAGTKLLPSNSKNQQMPQVEGAP